MTTLAPIKLKCPVCTNEFKSQEIGSCGFASKRTDFRPNYWGFNPTEYFYHLCPDCGFCGGKKYFEGLIKNKEIKKEIKQMGILKDYSLPEKIKRAANCLQIMKKHRKEEINDFLIGDSWIKAFWWALSTDKEKEYGEKAIKFFEKALKSNQIPEDQIMGIRYLLGEIYRRIGKPKEANKKFDDVIALTENKEEYRFIYQLAKQQKKDPKDTL
ncbi:MAG: hypothetical protein BAJALOKI2v1_50029 [Promethearchaeota archaeon]|nr:MAG: hypothetical protein BAJALOKI2v1_50029 [Candidatus Lokiarchaeota archaeon]